jgi:hypothetical protein
MTTTHAVLPSYAGPVYAAWKKNNNYITQNHNIVRRKRLPKNSSRKPTGKEKHF